MSNPKTHDNLFKWLVGSFTHEFFAYFFPSVKMGQIEPIDKEFISKYESLKESIKSDLFLMPAVEIDGVEREIMVLFEHQSKRADMSMRVGEYCAYAYLLRKRPVWCIVFYTDDAVWRKPVPDSFPYSFHSGTGIQSVRYDMIKLKNEQSAELVQRRSLMLKLLALKADDNGCDPIMLVRGIYREAHELGEQLSNDKKLLIDKFVHAYGKVTPQKVTQIKKEAGMTYVASSITEHYELIGEERGEKRGEIRGAILNLTMLRDEGSITEALYEAKVAPLREKLAKLEHERKGK